MTRTPRRRRLVLAAATAALAFPGTAGAHALLTRSEPADGARLDAAPRAVTLRFSEEVSPRFRSVTLLDRAGRRVAGVRVRRSHGPSSSITVDVPRLKRGAYALVWHAVSEDDGHATGGTVVFGVRTAVAPAAAPVAGPGGLGSFVDAALRWLQFSLIAIVIGGLAFVGLVLRSAGPWVDSEVVGRSRRRILGAAAVGAALALAVQVAVLVRQAAAVAPADAPELWAARVRDLIASTRWGTLWLTEVLLLCLAVAVVHALRRSRDFFPPAAATAGALCAVGLAVVQALGSHAASLSSSTGPVLADAVHVLAASLWMGGVASLLIFLWPFGRVRLRETAPLAVAVRRPFALLAACATFALVVTGLYAAGFEVASVDALLLTAYGRTLLAKSALVALAGALGICNFILLRRLAARTGGRVVRLTIVAEAALGAAAFAAAGMLTASTPSRGPSFTPPSRVEPLTISRQLQDLVVTVTVRPNRPGTNAISFVTASTRRPPPARIEAVEARIGFRGVAALPRKVAGGGWLTLAVLDRRAERFTVAIRRNGKWLAAPFTWRVGPADTSRPIVVSSRRLAPITNRAALSLLLGLSVCAAFALVVTRRRPAPHFPRLEGLS